MIGKTNAAGYEPEYEEDRYAGEYDEQAYVDPAQGRRRRLYIGVAAAVGLLVVGGTGVYGYRALFGKYSGGTAPTIRPADSPSKVAPTAQAGEGGQKLIYDRLDGPKQGERIVSREEKPADVAQGTGRVVTAPPSAGPVTAFAPVTSYSAECARGDHRYRSRRRSAGDRTPQGPHHDGALRWHHR